MNTFPTIMQIALTKCNICVNAAVFQSFAVYNNFCNLIR